MIRTAITKDMDVAIGASTNYMERKRLINSTKSLKASTQVISTMLSKRIFQYFDHWRQVQMFYKVNLHTKVKDRVLSMYKRYLASYFDHWKD